jgi:hypothetical protein
MHSSACSLGLAELDLFRILGRHELVTTAGAECLAGSAGSHRIRRSIAGLGSEPVLFYHTHAPIHAHHTSTQSACYAHKQAPLSGRTQSSVSSSSVASIHQQSSADALHGFVFISMWGRSTANQPLRRPWLSRRRHWRPGPRLAPPPRPPHLAPRTHGAARPCGLFMCVHVSLEA